MKDMTSISQKSLTRRNFLKNAGAAAGLVLGVPYFVPSSVFGGTAPSNRINIACIGTGNQGFNNMRAFLQNDDARVVAVCDVNKASFGYKHPSQYYGREPAKKEVNDFYARKNRSGIYKGCDSYIDFRQVLARDDVDAVVITVPDHWHAVMANMAARAGKDIYCEKPMTLTIAEGPSMIETVRRYGTVFQTGSHERSSERSRFACELVRNGRIGQLKRIVTTVGPNNKTCPPGAWEPTPIHEGFDYNMWLGPAPWEPYHKDRCFYTFRFLLDYSGGQTTNYGAHSNDLAQWGNDTEYTGPVEIEDMGAVFPKNGLFTTATYIHFRAQYANGVELICKTGPENMQVRFEGTEGWVQTGYRGFSTYPESLKTSVIGPNEIHLYKSRNHYRNFLDCIKTRSEPAAPIEVGHRSATLCHLGNIAMMLKRKLRWDPQNERFVDNDMANRLMSKPIRSPWRL
jgi:predicted dehydrogenase